MKIPERNITATRTTSREDAVTPRMGAIYCIASPSGKRYIGQTKYSMEKRFGCHKSEDTATKGCKALGRAAMKYGWDKMTLTLIEKCPLEKLNEREIYWIAHYNTFLGDGYNLTAGGAGVMKIWRSFREARAFARSLHLSGEAAWRQWRANNERPDDIPSAPDVVYKDKGWVSWGDWFGTGNGRGAQPGSHKHWRTFDEARAFARSLHLTSSRAWEEWCTSGARPRNIPTDPRGTYKDKGWAGIGDWLGTDNVPGPKSRMRPFAEARTFVRSLHLRGKKEYALWSKSGKRPDNIPAGPSQTYNGKGWVSWGNWLGTGHRRSRTRMRPFAEARTFVRSLNIKSLRKWYKYWKTHEKPPYIPYHPERSYKDKGWVSWKDFLIPTATEISSKNNSTKESRAPSVAESV